MNFISRFLLSHSPNYRQMLRELIPSDLLKIQSSSDWKRLINASYNQDAGMSSEDAKVTFLKIVYRYVLV